MDAKLFRLPTQPNFYASIASASPFDTDQRQRRQQLPAPDNRYPGWAGPMADGRLVTSYQNHCSENVPAGKQYATKEWMTKNAMELIKLSRDRFSWQTGAYLGLSPTVVPPAAMTVTCTSSDCSRVHSEEPGGIGMERGETPAPDLFGTWDPTTGGIPLPRRTNTGLTTRYEGGRNTPRGYSSAEPELR